MTDPSLIPSLAAIVKHILADPTGAALAIKDNLSLAAKDIAMPTVLAVLRVDVLGEQTAQSVQSDMPTGHSAQVLADLGTFLQGLGTVLNETLTDPATSITAGFLNARDDLAVSVINAASYAALADLSTVVPSGAGSLLDVLP